MVWADFSQNCQHYLVLKCSDLLPPLKCGWLSSFNNLHYWCQVIQIFPSPLWCGWATCAILVIVGIIKNNDNSRIVIRTPTIFVSVGTSALLRFAAIGQTVTVTRIVTRTPTILVTVGTFEILDIRMATVTRMAPPRPQQRGRESRPGHSPSL